MTRHSQNVTAHAVYSYHEKRRDQLESGFGSEHVRLGKDSVRQFDSCCLTLQPCRDPVVTPQGWLYDREAIIEYMIRRKKEVARQMKEYERQLERDLELKSDLARAEHQQDVTKYLEVNSIQRSGGLCLAASGVGASTSVTAKTMAEEAKLLTGVPDSRLALGGSVTPGHGGRRPESISGGSAATTASSSAPAKSAAGATGSAAPVYRGISSFWVPSMTPSAISSRVEKPDEKVRCPMSGSILRMKDLIKVNFTAINDDDAHHRVAAAAGATGSVPRKRKADIIKDVRYRCALTGDALTNNSPCCVLKSSGRVITQDSLNKLLRRDKDSMRDPETGVPLTDADIIPLQRGASGFAASGQTLTAKKSRPTMN